MGGGKPLRKCQSLLHEMTGRPYVTSPKSKDIEEGEKSTENPAGVKGDIKYVQDEGPDGPDVDTKVKPKGGSKPHLKGERDDKPSAGQHVDNGEELVNNPNADQQAEAKKKGKGTGEPTKKGDEPGKKAEPEMEEDKQPAPGKKSKSGPQAPLKGKPGDKKAKGGPGKKMPKDVDKAEAPRVQKKK